MTSKPMSHTIVQDWYDNNYFNHFGRTIWNSLAILFLDPLCGSFWYDSL